MVESLLYSSEDAKKDLTRDGDPRIFKQLLAEDDYDLKLIDIALPNQFRNRPDLNDLYRSLRPYMVNMHRHTIEKTARYMEKSIIHDNTGLLAGNEDNDGEDLLIGPRLLIEGAESYYTKK